MTDEPDTLPVELDAFQQALNRKPRHVTLRMAANPSDALKLAELRREAMSARAIAERNPSDETASQAASDAALEHDAFLESIDVFTFEFRAIGASTRDELETGHPPTAAQQQKHKRDQPDAPALTYNPETYPAAMIAASLVSMTSPDGQTTGRLSEAQVRTLFESDGWTDADRAQLFVTALQADQVITKVEAEALGNG